MALRHALANLAILLGQWRSLVAQAHIAPMLEIHAVAPKWVNGCLDLTVERVNISTQPIYVPEWEGIIFSLSTKLIHDDLRKKDQEFWQEFYGLSDIVYLDAYQLAAGSKTIDHACLPETFAVVNQQGKTRRQVAVRGRLKIAASYFATEEEWRKNKAEEEEQFSTRWHPPLEKRLPGTGWRPLQASLEISVPCLPQSECAADCTTSPPIIEGERFVVPDVFQFYKDWNDRGKTSADALYRKYSACK